jgi:hypothetical protein
MGTPALKSRRHGATVKAAANYPTIAGCESALHDLTDFHGASGLYLRHWTLSQGPMEGVHGVECNR